MSASQSLPPPFDFFKDLVRPTVKQEAFFWALSNYRFVLYGGAAGGGKSYSMRWGLVYLLLRWWAEYHIPGVEVGLFCEDYPALAGRHMGKIRSEFPEWLGEPHLGDSKDQKFVLSPKYGGGQIKFRNLDNPEKYKSVEFAAIAVDELTQNDEQVFDDLRFRLRWPGIPRPVFMAGTNPGGRGHAWVKNLWITRSFPKNILSSGLDQEFCYVPARVTDNPHIPASYADDLSSLPDKLRRAYLDGSWDVFEGQAFQEWDAMVHVEEPFTPPARWKRLCSMDWGFSAPYVVLWGAVDEEGVIHVYRELAGHMPGRLNEGSRHTAEQVGRLIADAERQEAEAVLSRDGELPSHVYHVADPAIWQRTGHDSTFLSIADVFSQQGVHFSKANNNRLQGWACTHSYLAHEDGPPRLKVSRSCRYLIDTLPSLVYDKNVVDDIDSDGPDHAADSLRYMLMTRPLPTEKRKLPQPQMDWIDRLTLQGHNVSGQSASSGERGFLYA